jgi:hypothetical protein
LSRGADPLAVYPRAKAIKNADGDDEQQSPGKNFRLHGLFPSEDATGEPESWKRARASIGRMHDYWAPMVIVGEAIAASVDVIVRGLPADARRNVAVRANKKSF